MSLILLEKLRASSTRFLIMIATTPLVVFLLIVCPMLVVITSTQSLKERKSDLWDYEEMSSGLPQEKMKCNLNAEFCKNGMDGSKIEFLESFAKRRSNQEGHSAELAAAAAGLDIKNAKIIPFYHTFHRMPCTCGMEPRLLDLGLRYYPRYLPSAVCKKDGCAGSKCIEKHYRVRVLRQRNPPGLESSEIPTLPENLRDFWEPETVTVTVACECSQ